METCQKIPPQTQVLLELAALQKELLRSLNTVLVKITKIFQMLTIFSEYVVYATRHALQEKNMLQCFVCEQGGVEIPEVLSTNSNPKYDYGQFYQA